MKDMNMFYPMTQNMQLLNDGQSWLEPNTPFPDAKDLV